jgi:nucleoside-diphosphate-sugar epimerase
LSNTKKILVTGSSGKLGKEIVKQLRIKKYTVVGIDHAESKFTDIIVDIRDKSKILRISKGIDAIIHTAALHGKHYDLGFTREEFIETNIGGTLNLLSTAVKHGIKKFLYTSTTSIYGRAMVDPLKAVWVDEELIPKPRDIYDITKLTCELLCRDYFEKEGIESTILRVSRFLPEDENTKANHRLYRGLDESDGATAHILTLEKSFNSFNIYNISNKSPFHIADLEQLYQDPKSVILKYYPDATQIYKSRGWRFPVRIDRVYVIDKAEKELNFKPKMNFSVLIDE